MADYCFFKKRKHILAVEKKDTAAKLFLLHWGYSKLPEELTASDAEKALEQLDAMHQEAHLTRSSYTLTSAFSAVNLAVPVILLWSVFGKLFNQKNIK